MRIMPNNRMTQFTSSVKMNVEIIKRESTCWHFPGGVLVRFRAIEFISKNWLISSTINSFGWWYDDDRMATWNALICLGLDSQFCKETFREKYSILAASMQPARSRAKRSFTCCFVFESTNDKMHLLEMENIQTQYSILAEKYQLFNFNLTTSGLFDDILHRTVYNVSKDVVSWGNFQQKNGKRK